ncbi:hypothetical protein C8J56DRAFT_83295 [Mycena floridula]|nr:hypothetical protein C8J56DRAFT_83295 [Mycena floridula]
MADLCRSATPSSTLFCSASPFALFLIIMTSIRFEGLLRAVCNFWECLLATAIQFSFASSPLLFVTSPSIGFIKPIHVGARMIRSLSRRHTGMICCLTETRVVAATLCHTFGCSFFIVTAFFIDLSASPPPNNSSLHDRFAGRGGGSEYILLVIISKGCFFILLS